MRKIPAKSPAAFMGELKCSRFFTGNFVSALFVQGFRSACDQFEADCEALLWEWLPLSTALVNGLSRRIRRLSASVFIRASDALHLESAAEQGFKEIYSDDRRLLEAASHFGLRGITV